MRTFQLKSLLAALLVAMAGLTAAADSRSDLAANPNLAANNYRAYPDQNLPKLTAAPAGYEPFYINHYGRHGSRWLISQDQYSYCVQKLDSAQQAGVITPLGRDVLEVLRDVEAAAHNRLGELSDKGAEQHQGIARRMVENFPQVWAGNAWVDARSTIVIRCILSMQNELTTLTAINPNLRVSSDASEHDMHYMNYDDTLGKRIKQPVIKELRPQWSQQWLAPKRLLQSLFTSSEWTDAHVDGNDFMIYLYDLASNMQSHNRFDGIEWLTLLFTPDELYDLWRYRNMGWYLWSGNSPLTQNYVPYMEANLLQNFLDCADAAIARGENGADLRFGHESVVLPLVALMGINGMDLSTTDTNEINEKFQTYKVFPMAANLQLVYYRKAGAPVLVKVLLNEHEATLPAQLVPVAPGSFYDWNQVKAFYQARLAAKPQVR